MIMPGSMRLLATAALAPAALAPAAAFAQAEASPETRRAEAPPAGGDDMVVTAQPREQRLLDVPISVSAMSGEALETQGVTQPTQLAGFVAGLQIVNQGPVARFAIRGITLNEFGDANEPPVAFYSDDVYIASTAAIRSTFFDVSRVEVLRGPQGTLFGRNATGGLVQVISNSPGASFGGNVGAQYGSFDQLLVNGAVDIPIAPWLKTRFSGIFDRDDGWQRNVFNGNRWARTNSLAVRGIADIELSSAVTDRVKVQVGRTRDVSPGFGFNGLFADNGLGAQCSNEDILAALCFTRAGYRDPDPDPRHIQSDLVEPRHHVDTLGIDNTLKYDGDGFAMTAITAFQRTRRLYEDDVDSTPLPMFGSRFRSTRKQFSQEVRFSGESGRVTYLLGGYFFYERVGPASTVLYQAIPILNRTIGLRNDFRLTTDAWAGFGQLNYALSDDVTLTAGGRYSTEVKRLSISDDFTQPSYTGRERAKADRFTWKLGLDWRPAPGWLTYASVATGFKSPAFNTTLVGPGGSVPSRPEKNISYEIGVKGETADRRFSLSAATFYTDYRDFQIIAVPTNAPIPLAVLRNADKAEIYGVEAETVLRPVPGLRIVAALGVASWTMIIPRIEPIDWRRGDVGA